LVVAKQLALVTDRFSRREGVLDIAKDILGFNR